MEEYPEELRSPPLPLVALLGIPELHQKITQFFRKDVSAMATVSVFDLSGVGDLDGKERRPVDARLPPPVGILKAGWLTKHRQQNAAVATALLERDRVYGDPNQWSTLCSQIDTVKSVCRARNMKLVILVIQEHPGGEVNEDRLSALRKRAEIDSRCCLPLVVGEGPDFRRGLQRFASVAAELATVFYREEGRRVKARLEKRSYSAADLSVRYNFKIAVFAEFRHEWATALKHYEAGYLTLEEVPTTPLELQPLERLVELKTVAEYLHFKIITLLLHCGKELEAIRWFRHHIATWKLHLGPPEAMFLHWAWMARQYQTFAELLARRLTVAGGSGADRTGTVSGQGPLVAVGALPTPVCEREMQPAFYLQLAAKYAIERRRTFENALATGEAFGDLDGVDVLAGPPEAIGPPLYVGQPPRILSRGLTPDVQRPSEAEYLRHTLNKERALSHSALTVDLLTRAHDQFRGSHAGRVICQLGFEMGREYIHAGEYANALNVFNRVAGMYRKEAWIIQLAATLLYLRQCASNLGRLQDFVEFSLELVSLPFARTPTGDDSWKSLLRGPGGSGEKTQVDMQTEVVSLLESPEAVPKLSSLFQQPAAGSPDDAAAPAAPPGLLPQVSISADAGASFRGIFAVVAAFASPAVEPGEVAELNVGILHSLPGALPLTGLLVRLNVSGCDTLLMADHEEDGVAVELASRYGLGPAEALSYPRLQSGLELTLPPRAWHVVKVQLRMPEQPGALSCSAVELLIGRTCSISCPVESSADALPQWCHELLGKAYARNLRVTLPFPCPPPSSLHLPSAPSHTFGPLSYNDPLATPPTTSQPPPPPSSGPITPSIRVERPTARLELLLPSPGPALLGEPLPVRIRVTARSHAIRDAILTIQVYDSALTPTPEPVDSPPLEPPVAGSVPCTIGLAGSLTVPNLGADDRWSTVVLMQSPPVGRVQVGACLRYRLPGGGLGEQGARIEDAEGSGRDTDLVEVRQGAEIDCEEPWTVRHRFLAPFRRDPLLLVDTDGKPPGPGGELRLDSAGASADASADGRVVLAVGEASTVSVTVQNSSHLPLRLLSLTVEEASGQGEDGESLSLGATSKSSANSCSISPLLPEPPTSLHPGEEQLEVEEGGEGGGELRGEACDREEAVTRLFRVVPKAVDSALRVGTVVIRWVRQKGPEAGSLGEGEGEGQVRGDSQPAMASHEEEPQAKGSEAEGGGRGEEPEVPAVVVTTRVPLPPVPSMQAPLVVTVECPPRALLGEPLCLGYSIQNRTSALQTINFSVVDVPGFVLSGAHSGSAAVLPLSSYTLSYVLVPVAAGMLNLPKVHFVASRYGAKLNPGPHSSKLFVHPTLPTEVAKVGVGPPLLSV